MPGLVLAWLVGEGIIIYRSWSVKHQPPMPGQLLASSGLFAALGLLGRTPQGATLAAVAAWGFDIAAFLNVAPQMLAGGASAKANAAVKAADTPGTPHGKPRGQPKRLP
jgi:hypothetical protein